MKLRHSLRVYVATYVLVAGIGLQLAFGVIAYQYFFIGVDSSYTGLLYVVANNIEAPEQGLKKVEDINLSSNWQDQPADIRAQIPEPPPGNVQLLKVTEHDWLWLRPLNIYYAIKIIRNDGKTVYLSSHITRQMIDAVSPQMGYIEWLYVFLAAAVLSSALILLYLLSKTSRQVEKLKRWAKKLDQNGVDVLPPKFKYAELTELANIISKGVLEVRNSVTREKNFLSYASHELRTPITTIVANLELLKRNPQPLPDAVLKPIQRIDRSAQTMQHLTETLLWLNRKNELQLEFSQLDLSELILQICDTLQYLLQGKPVTLDIQSEKHVIRAKGAAVHIALTNIIKNAFQHTYEGHISICQQANRVIIENHNIASEEDVNLSELGYGLGLRLIQEITDTFNWRYVNRHLADGRYVEIYFPDELENHADSSVR